MMNWSISICKRLPIGDFRMLSYSGRLIVHNRVDLQCTRGRCVHESVISLKVGFASLARMHDLEIYEFFFLW